MNLIEKIRDTETKLRDETNPVRQMESWTMLERLLGRMPVDKSELTRVLKEGRVLCFGPWGKADCRGSSVPASSLRE